MLDLELIEAAFLFIIATVIFLTFAGVSAVTLIWMLFEP